MARPSRAKGGAMKESIDLFISYALWFIVMVTIYSAFDALRYFL